MSKPTTNELQRLLALSSFGIDYFEPNRGLNNLVELASKIAGSEVSVINLLDAHTQWTIAALGMERGQRPIEESVCQFTIQQDTPPYFEVEDLSKDDRFKDQDYVTGELQLRYYLGVPLTTREGYSIGALCVMDQRTLKLSPLQIELLGHVAQQIVDRLKTNQFILDLRHQLVQSQKTTHKLAHDVRGPISGIVGLGEILNSGDLSGEDAKDVIEMMIQGGKGVIDMVSGILREEMTNGNALEESPLDFSLEELQERLIHLYVPQALVKEIDLRVKVTSQSELRISKNLLIQTLGNLISNAIKFTPKGGQVQVLLSIQEEEEKWFFIGKVIDSGIGMSQAKITEILNLQGSSEDGSEGEKGFGLGLKLVQNLLHQVGGEFSIHSELEKGSEFTIKLSVS